MSTILREVTREAKKLMVTNIGAYVPIKLSPRVDALPDSAFERSNLPLLMMQGPTIERTGRNYRRESVFKEMNPQGAKVNTVTKSRSIVDLVFRMRLLTIRQIQALDLVGRLAALSATVTEVMYDGINYLFVLNEDWEANTVPNFSDLIHHEGMLRVEKVEVDSEVTEDVVEVKEPPEGEPALHIEMEKKED